MEGLLSTGPSPSIFLKKMLVFSSLLEQTWLNAIFWSTISSILYSSLQDNFTVIKGAANKAPKALLLKLII